MFNERLKMIRTQKGLTQKEVAASIRLGERNYQSFEYGECKPSFDTLIALADLFDVSLDYLVGRTSAKESDTAIL
ncbi:helix-turn-helix transcriptional regulator [Ruminococcus sp.]|uniref:helix-turn-helix domain-containing protein n=1 Tax=Ruminococcus sp. TaxID=41978 RepID=UPI0025F9CD3B|nr:helix-turn-helix transcriptional regulator [Ruminococcus sp.]MBQ6252483.1 helix-turn-helix transcriptional regulator [Ruminococcus sp.]